ncbi:histidine kinase [Clostridium sp. C8-1-8]|uniref:sensor histidine kinase n=1 Tax=Clostridium sp. C8-1-8 TaxID=2698831 RepID=UPI00136820A4|nr:histidine kinase [Clostridium sp. C8-1-8]
MKNRSDYLLILRVLIIIYATYNYIDEGKSSFYIVVLILLYCISSIVYFMIIDYKYSLCISIISILIILYSGYYINYSYILLIPCSIYDIVDRLKVNKFMFPVISILAIVIINVNKAINPTYLFIIFILVIFDSMFTNYFFRVKQLIEENDILREKNNKYSREIDDLKSHEKQVQYTTQLEERNSLSQKMHDKIGHTIAASLMQLEAAKYIMKGDSDKATEMLNSSIKVLREGMDDIRITLRKIKPVTEQLGINRVKMILEECTKGTELKYMLVYTGDLDRIRYNHWSIILDSIKESLTNTIKYSNASRIEVNIDVLNKVIRVFIKDNGIGIDNIKKGLGLIGIEQRCIDCGGNALFDGSDGFVVTLLLPI